MTTLDIAEARRLAAQLLSHPVSRGIDEIEAAGEMIYALADELERLRSLIISKQAAVEMLDRMDSDGQAELERLRAQVASAVTEEMIGAFVRSAMPGTDWPPAGKPAHEVEETRTNLRAALAAALAQQAEPLTDFEHFWEGIVADNGGTSIGADYKHWARLGFQAGRATQSPTVGDRVEPPGYVLVPLDPTPYLVSMIPGHSYEIAANTYRSLISSASLSGCSVTVGAWSCYREANTEWPRCTEWCKSPRDCPASYEITHREASAPSVGAPTTNVSRPAAQAEPATNDAMHEAVRQWLEIRAGEDVGIDIPELCRLVLRHAPQAAQAEPVAKWMPWSKAVESASLLLNRATDLPLDDCEGVARAVLSIAQQSNPPAQGIDEREAFDAWLLTAKFEDCPFKDDPERVKRWGAHYDRYRREGWNARAALAHAPAAWPSAPTASA